MVCFIQDQDCLSSRRHGWSFSPYAFHAGTHAADFLLLKATTLLREPPWDGPLNGRRLEPGMECDRTGPGFKSSMKVSAVF